MNEEDRREPVGQGPADEGGSEAEDQPQPEGAPEEQPEPGGAPEDQEQANGQAEEPPEAEESAEEDGQTEAAPEPDVQAEEPPAPDAPAPERLEGDAPPAEQPEGDAPPAEPLEADVPAAEQPAPEAPAQPQEPQPTPPERGEGGGARGEVVPGADLEPDLVLEQPTRSEGDDYGDAAYAERYADPEPGEEPAPEGAEDAAPEQAPGPLTPRELAADARYQATGKRKTAVARVILKPGSGAYTVNGSALEQFFPRPTLQNTARQPLTAAGYQDSMDVVARLHGGGVSAQAGALRHGIARALADADPALRGEMKRRGYLTRDPRVKERKKAGLKKARKRPQFSKR